MSMESHQGKQAELVVIGEGTVKPDVAKQTPREWIEQSDGEHELYCQEDPGILFIFSTLLSRSR